MGPISVLFGCMCATVPAIPAIAYKLNQTHTHRNKPICIKMNKSASPCLAGVTRLRGILFRSANLLFSEPFSVCSPLLSVCQPSMLSNLPNVSPGTSQLVIGDLRYRAPNVSFHLPPPRPLCPGGSREGPRINQNSSLSPGPSQTNKMRRHPKGCQRGTHLRQVPVVLQVQAEIANHVFV